MGTWGPGLYSNDLAKDLKSTIASVLKLPLKPVELVRLLEESFPVPSRQQDESEYAAFWLVVADQFHRCGINEPTVFERATEIVDSGMDSKYPEIVEMAEPDRRKRQKVLAELRERIAEPPKDKQRKTLTKPQPLLLNAGDLFIYPVFIHGQCVNPYSARWNHEQRAWGSAFIIRSSHIFEYLACYHAIVLSSFFELAHKPSSSELLSVGKRGSKLPTLLSRTLEPDSKSTAKWELRRPGTCSKIHVQRLQLEIIDRLPLDEKKLVDHFPKIRDGRYQAVNDISLSNSLGASPEADATLDCLDELIK